MKKSKWTQDEIISLFSRLPQMQDSRNPQEIYERVVAPKQMKRRPNRWLTVTSSAAAICLIVFFFSTFLIKEEAKENSRSKRDDSLVMETSDTNLKEEEEAGKQQETETKNDSSEKQAKVPESEDLSIAMLKEGSFDKLLFQDDLDGMGYATIGFVASSMANIVPITVKVADGHDPVDALEKAKTLIGEKRYGLQANHSEMDITYIPEDRAVMIKIAADQSSVVEDSSLQSLIEAFRYQDVKRLRFYSNDGAGIRFSKSGFMEELILDHHPQRAIYLYRPDESLLQLLVPSVKSYASITEALQAMQEGDESSGMEASIPDSIQFEKVEAKQEKLLIAFSEQTKLENIESDRKAVEAILALAREFGYREVEFQGSPIDSLGNLRLNQEMDVPIALNAVNRQ